MKNSKKGLVISAANSSYLSAFQYVREAERRLRGTKSKRAQQHIRSAYAALEQALHVDSHARKSTLYLAARMAAGLSLRELTLAPSINDAA